MTIYPFRAGHLENLLLQPAQAYLRPCFQPEHIKAYEQAHSFSLLADDGSTLACAGLVEIWPGRAMAWALLSAEIGARGMLVVTRACRREFALGRYRRIEAYVDRGFASGHKWMAVLGFENETPNGMRGFSPEGATHDLYTRIS